MITLGRCPVCMGWTLVPTTASCRYCFNRVAPLGPLSTYQVEEDARIDAHGQLFSAKGELLHTYKVKNPETPDGEVAWLRKLLLEYDEGMHSENSVAFELFRRVIEPIFERAQKGDRTAWGLAWCGDEPPRGLKGVVVKIESNGYEIGVTPLKAGETKWCANCVFAAHVHYEENGKLVAPGCPGFLPKV